MSGDWDVSSIGDSRILGRDTEISALGALLQPTSPSVRAVVIRGDAGMGKTTLLEHTVERAAGSGWRVLIHKADEGEAGLGFTGLSDLLGPAFDEVTAQLAVPRRRALEVALLLTEPGDDRPDPRAVGMAVLDTLRLLARPGPLLLAIDDLQWLDQPTATALAFALRRMTVEPVVLLGTLRHGMGARRPLELDQLLPAGSVSGIDLTPLGPGPIFRLLYMRLGLAVSRPELLRIHGLANGNPFFALEIGRAIREATERGVDPPPVPRDLETLLGRRLKRLTPAARRLLVAAAALVRADPRTLAAALDRDNVEVEIDEAVRAGIMERAGQEVRFAHPLLAAVCLSRATPAERRRVHGRIAKIVVDPLERTRHLALASVGADAELADQLDAAATWAASRGATSSAAELAEWAARTTPVGAAAAERRRRLAAARWHRLSGDQARAARILHGLLSQGPAGVERADVLIELARCRPRDLRTALALAREAAAEAGQDDGRSAEILAFVAWLEQSAGDIGTSLETARTALLRAERLGDPRRLAAAIGRVAMAETWAMAVTPGLLERGIELEQGLDKPLAFGDSPSITLARRHALEARFDEARSIYAVSDERARSLGDEATHGRVLFHLGLLEWYAGQTERALAIAAEAEELAGQLHDDQYRSMVLHLRSFIDAHLGRLDQATQAAGAGLAIASGLSDRLFRIAHRGVLGFIELSRGDHAAAARWLRRLPGFQVHLGWLEPAFNPVWPNMVEALIGIGEIRRARIEVDAFRPRAARSCSEWSSAILLRVEGLLLAAEGDAERALTPLAEAVAASRRVGSPFDTARSLLALGSVQRRSRRKRPARLALEEAAAIFEQVGARGRAVQALAEARRVGGRPAPMGRLTDTEERIADLAAAGLSNKEIAAAVGSSAHTVEAHLTHIYRKLALRSRTELARWQAHRER